MSETAEERTEDWFTEKCRDPEFVKAYLAEQQKMYDDDLRSAVAAQKEKDASVDPDTIVDCPDCGAKIGNECTDTDPDSWGYFPGGASHDDRWRAAIRASE